ncbi:MAG: phosphotransferase [Alphaproteobacteria bacterium]|nr:phosphotransferase [Alphaproteobacteria bacterium]
MRGSLGEKIGEGAYSDVHAWAPGQVVKLFKTGLPQRHAWWEARMTRAVAAAGAPAPEVLDEVTLEGRFGIVLRRLDGPTLLQLSRSGAMSPAQVGAVLATLCLSVHRIAAPPDVLSVRDMMTGSLRDAGGALPEPIANGILALIERLPTGEQLCHGDVPPGNVIMTAQGPRFVDWQGAIRASVGYDLACCHVMHCDLAADMVSDPERPRANDAATRSAYARLAGISTAALTAAAESYLPVIRVFVLLGPAGSPTLRERLIPIPLAFDSRGGFPDAALM